MTRDHCLEWIEYLADTPSKATGKPLGVISRKQRISGLSQLFWETAAWEYNDVPGYALISVGDAPKAPQRVPRFIPDHELDQLMPVIDEITCPFQRAALLAVRWSGARRDEIRRLPIDCLDRYPDGTPRLRLPARKTYKERTVPLHQDAADALQKVIDLRKQGRDRPFTDERTGEQIRYLFVRHGKLISSTYLFEDPLQKAGKAVGLVGPGGWHGKQRGTVSAHRFRHTVGTQLAERGAKLHTIMKVLGHSSVSMALVYAQVSDREVLRDYKSVLEPGAVIAGPAAAGAEIRTLPAEAVRLAEDQLLQDRAGARPLPAPARRGPLRVRPLPDLRQVRHHPRVRPAAAGPPGGRAAARPRRRRTRLDPRSRTAHRRRPATPVPAHRPRRDHRPRRRPPERTTTLHVYRLSEPIDDFDGLTPLNEWLDGDAERLAWALRAVLALAEAAPTVGWNGDMRHLPLVGHLPTSPFVTRYLVAKQDNNGDTFLICQADPAELLDHAAADEVTPGPIGPGCHPTPATCAWTSPNPASSSPASTRPSPPSDRRRSP